MSIHSNKFQIRLVVLTVPLFISLWFWSFALAQIDTSQADTTGTVNRGANLRAGPGTDYAVVGGATQGQQVQIVGSNPAGNWLQLESGQWIAAFLIDVAPDSPSTATVTTTVPTTAPTVADTDATALRDANLRAGPGTNYAVVEVVRSGQALRVQGSNVAGTWLQLSNGNWIAAFLVRQAVTTQPPQVANPETANPPTAPATAVPTVTATPTAPPTQGSGSTFFVTRKRLLNPAENGGSTDGPSVHCGYGRALTVHVLDENGNRLNGVPVQAQFGAKETIVTGAQGKGDGVVEFVLGGGQEVKVLRNPDGSSVSSETATGLSTDPRNIPFDTLISGGYCQDEQSCQTFADNVSCIGHFSWEVYFQRRP